jgi:hypothetical protein
MKISRKRLMEIISEEIDSIMNLKEEPIEHLGDHEEDKSEAEHSDVSAVKEEVKKVPEMKEKKVEKVQEETPPGREEQVKAIEKSDTPETYTDKKTGKKKESNPWAIAWASYNKSKGDKK